VLVEVSLLNLFYSLSGAHLLMGAGMMYVDICEREQDCWNVGRCTRIEILLIIVSSLL
jgi:hypothetical protein